MIVSKYFFPITLLAGCCLLTMSMIPQGTEEPLRQNVHADSLRNLYERPVAAWPAPHIDSGVSYTELGALLGDSGTSWLMVERDPKIKLGQMLFFDPRLSGSDQISCSSCHDPGIGWGDGRRVALGHDHTEGPRNTPSLLNVASQKTYFWDGRAGTLQEQAIGPLGAHHEMNVEMSILPKKIRKIKGYQAYFRDAYGDEHVTLDRILEALAAFEKIIHSRPSAFDLFVVGEYDALTDQQISGLDLFRRKARCMNCHHGIYFKDDQFHNIGLTYYGRKYQDLGRYEVTGKPEDVGKFRTPSLRDVMKTNPWMHNGLFDNILGVINIYNSGMHMLDDMAEDKNDPLYPKTDVLLQPLNLTAEEKLDLVAFMNAITATQYKMRRPELPASN